MYTFGIHEHVLIRGGIGHLHHALWAKDLDALIVAVGSLAAVIDGAHGAVFEPESCHGGVDVIRGSESGIDQDISHGKDFIHVAFNEVTGHIEIMDGHIQKKPP